MKAYKQFLKENKELNEAKQPQWRVTFKKQTVNGVKFDGKPVTVKARETREAIIKAGKKLGADKSTALSAKTKDIQKVEE